MANPNFNIDVTVDDGKYRFTQDVEGAILVYRYGQPWIEGSFAGINMVIAMACEIEELRPLAKENARLQTSLELFQAMADYIPRVALSELWEMLGVDNQTAAVRKLQGRAEQLKAAFLDGHRWGRSDEPVTHSAGENWERSQTRRSLGDRP